MSSRELSLTSVVINAAKRISYRICPSKNRFTPGIQGRNWPLCRSELQLAVLPSHSVAVGTKRNGSTIRYKESDLRLVKAREAVDSRAKG